MAEEGARDFTASREQGMLVAEVARNQNFEVPFREKDYDLCENQLLKVAVVETSCIPFFPAIVPGLQGSANREHQEHPQVVEDDEHANRSHLCHAVVSLI